MVWSQISDIPSFEDKPFAFWLLEFYGAVFIYLCNSVRPCTYVAPMFSVWVNEDQDLIPYAVNVYFTFSIFACVVLHDEALLPIGNIIPVGLKADWEERVTSKD